MARVKTGYTRARRHRKVISQVRGSRLSRGKHYKVAHETLMHAGQHAFIGRRLRKRDLRRLWIQRINAGLSQMDQAPKYGTLIHLLKEQHIELDRKMLADLAVNDPEAFQAVVTQAYGK